MNTKRSAISLLLIGMLLLTALACGLAEAATGVVPTAEPIAQATVETGSGPGSEPTQAAPVPTSTPVPDVTGPGGCSLNGEFVADVTIPDGTQIPPGKPFKKTWRMRNSGDCAWKPGTKLAFVSGDPMDAPASVVVEPTPPEGGVKISVDMTAPNAPGTYRGNWQLRSPDGTSYGSLIYVEIVVPSGGGPAVSPTAGAGSTAAASTTAAPTAGAQTTHVTIQLDAGNAGSSGSGGSGQAQAGDDAGDQRVIAYLSWDLSSIPAGAQIVSAEVIWGTQCFRGGDVGDCTGARSPFPALGNDRLGYLEIKHYQYGSLSNPPSVMLNPSLISPFHVYTSQPTGQLDVTDLVADDAANGQDFQLRITFEHDTYDSGIGNGIVFVEGSGPNRLEVVYNEP